MQGLNHGQAQPVVVVSQPGIPQQPVQNQYQQPDQTQYQQPQSGPFTTGLPQGWETATHPTTGQPYYFNRSTGQSQNEFPTAEPAQVGDGANLPPGWDGATDPATGRQYYFNRETGATQYEKPYV